MNEEIDEKEKTERSEDRKGQNLESRKKSMTLRSASGKRALKGSDH